jgi:hypothetical protein
VLYAVPKQEWTLSVDEMYLVAMDQQTRDDILAATAAHAELGPGYDHAIAEGLVERIGNEIDKRVDARIGSSPKRASPTVKTDQAARPAYWKGVGVGTGISSIFLVLAAANDGNHNSSRLLVAMIALWAVVGVTYVVFAWARRD